MKCQPKNTLYIALICISLVSFLYAEDIPDYAKVPKMSYVGAGYYAKILCSAVFISHRDPADVREVVGCMQQTC